MVECFVGDWRELARGILFDCSGTVRAFLVCHGGILVSLALGGSFGRPDGLRGLHTVSGVHCVEGYGGHCIRGAFVGEIDGIPI